MPALACNSVTLSCNSISIGPFLWSASMHENLQAPTLQPPLTTKPAFTSPNEFCRKQRPLLKTGQPNTEREKWASRRRKELSYAPWELSYAERVAFQVRRKEKQGLVQVRPDGSEGPGSGRGGARVWAPAPLGRAPAPPLSAAVSATAFLAGYAAAVAGAVAVPVAVSTSAERTVKTAPPSPDPEDQPAAKRRVRRVSPPWYEVGLQRAAYDNGSLLQHAHSAPPPAQAAIVSAVPVPTRKPLPGGKTQKPEVSSLPPPWQKLTRNDGRKYYYNPQTQVILTLAPAPNPNPSPHPSPTPNPHPNPNPNTNPDPSRK